MTSNSHIFLAAPSAITRFDAFGARANGQVLPTPMMELVTSFTQCFQVLRGIICTVIVAMMDNKVLATLTSFAGIFKKGTIGLEVSAHG